MIILPCGKYTDVSHEKIATYQFLADIGCPVFKSVLFDEDESVTLEKIETMKKLFKSNYCTIRYQYLKPTITPIRGGNKTEMTLENISSKKIVGTQMWLLEPIDRTTNLYGINIHINRERNLFVMECVGKGFDVSDLNRGDISPHESIEFEYPVECGWQNEWWKFLSVNIMSDNEFQRTKNVRLKKLLKLGYDVTEKIFDEKYRALPYCIVEKLLKYVHEIDENWNKSEDYVVSISITASGKIIFWDIQTPCGKAKILKKQ